MAAGRPPAAWAVLELLRAHHPLGGFPWGLLAVSQHDQGPCCPWRVVGGFGLAAVIVAVNLAVALWLRTLLAGAYEGRPRARWAALAGLPLLVVACSGPAWPCPRPRRRRGRP